MVALGFKRGVYIFYSQVMMDVGLAYQNGVHIELIHQTNDVLSPYSEFYQTDKAQVLHQVAYLCPDIDAAVATGKAAGLKEVGYIKTMMGNRYIMWIHRH